MPCFLARQRKIGKQEDYVGYNKTTRFLPRNLVEVSELLSCCLLFYTF